MALMWKNCRNIKISNINKGKNGPWLVRVGTVFGSISSFQVFRTSTLYPVIMLILWNSLEV